MIGFLTPVVSIWQEPPGGAAAYPGVAAGVGAPPPPPAPRLPPLR